MATAQQLQFEFLLPSNRTWRMRNYFRLVARQRALAAETMPTLWPAERVETPAPRWETTPQPEAKRARRTSESLDNAQLSLSSTLSAETTWTASDICKASQLLARPPCSVSFHDEEEMRRVYSLIYDVFRYKSILNQALVDTMFLLQFPQFQKQTNQVWLLLYDLYKRRFLPRDPHEEEARAELFDSCGLTELDAHLWSQHVRLAAAVARLRIKNNALKLSQLLPPHLRDEKVIALDEAPVTGWVNTCRTEREEISRLIERAGLVLSKNHDPLTPDEYRWDHVCPQFLLCHPGKRGDLAQSDLVRKHCVVLQDRAFCLGPATLGRLLVELQLTGAVLMTHINSPRTTAYLASLLAENDKIDALLAFGAGSRKAEYDEYLAQLCVRNTRVFAEKFVDLPSDTNLLEGVCAVLASPPNTYSGVMDPVDLVCSRGGDLGMLEVLTDPESASRSRVAGILEEQRRTLQRSMSQPQVQMVLYETHSIVPAENGDMVRRLVDEMNELARCRHVEEREGDDPPPNLEDVVIPPCDMFEVGDIVDVCKKCVRLEEEGCYLALIRRTEITRLDAKYMINVAESRGLFGEEPGSKKPTTASRAHKKRAVEESTAALNKGKGSRRSKVEVERIAAPTQASMMRRASSGQESVDSACPRHYTHTLALLMSRGRDARRWWGEAARYALCQDREEPLKLTRTDRPVFPLHDSDTEHLIPTKHRRKSCVGNGISSEEGSTTPNRLRIRSKEEQDDIVRRLSTPTQASLNRKASSRQERDSIKIIPSGEEIQRRLREIKRRHGDNRTVQYPWTEQDPFLNYLSTLSSDTAAAERHDQGIYRSQPMAVALMSQKEVSTGFQHLITTQNKGVHVKNNLSFNQSEDERNSFLQPTTSSLNENDEGVIVTLTESQKVSYLRSNSIQTETSELKSLLEEPYTTNEDEHLNKVKQIRTNSNVGDENIFGKAKENVGSPNSNVVMPETLKWKGNRDGTEGKIKEGGQWGGHLDTGSLLTRKREETTNLQEASIEKRDQYTVVDQSGKVPVTSKWNELTSLQDITSIIREQYSIVDLNLESSQWQARLSRDSQINDSMYPLGDISPNYPMASGVNDLARHEKEKNKQFIINELRKIINETSQEEVEAEKDSSELLRQAVNKNGKRAIFDSQSGNSQSNVISGQLVKRRAMNKPFSKQLTDIGRDESTNLKRNIDFVNKFSNYCKNRTFMGPYKRYSGKAFPFAFVPRKNEASEEFARKIEQEFKELKMLRNNLRGGNGETDNVSIPTSSIRDLMDKKNKTVAFSESKTDRYTFDGSSYNTTTLNQPDLNKMNAVTAEDSRRTPNTAASLSRSRQYLCEQYKLLAERLCTRARRHHGHPPRTRKTSEKRTRQVYIPPHVNIEFNEPSRLHSLRRNFQRQSRVHS